jgi:hypothetical protein
VSMELEQKWPVLGRHVRAAEWFGIWADLGRAPGTIDAYARGLAEYLQVCERDGIDPVDANRAQVAGFVRELTSRPSCRGGNVVALDSGVGSSSVVPGPAVGLGAVDIGEAVLAGQVGRSHRPLVPPRPLGIGGQRRDGTPDIAR